MIGHRVRAALAYQQQHPERPEPRYKNIKSRRIYKADAVASLCQRCGAIRRPGANGKLPPHKCEEGTL